MRNIYFSIYAASNVLRTLRTARKLGSGIGATDEHYLTRNRTEEGITPSPGDPEGLDEEKFAGLEEGDRTEFYDGSGNNVGLQQEVDTNVLIQTMQQDIMQLRGLVNNLTAHVESTIQTVENLTKTSQVLATQQGNVDAFDKLNSIAQGKQSENEAFEAHQSELTNQFANVAENVNKTMQNLHHEYEKRTLHTVPEEEVQQVQYRPLDDITTYLQKYHSNYHISDWLQMIQYATKHFAWVTNGRHFDQAPETDPNNTWVNDFDLLIDDLHDNNPGTYADLYVMLINYLAPAMATHYEQSPISEMTACISAINQIHLDLIHNNIKGIHCRLAAGIRSRPTINAGKQKKRPPTEAEEKRGQPGKTEIEKIIR